MFSPTLFRVSSATLCEQAVIYLVFCFCSVFAVVLTAQNVLSRILCQNSVTPLIVRTILRRFCVECFHVRFTLYVLRASRIVHVIIVQITGDYWNIFAINPSKASPRIRARVTRLSSYVWRVWARDHSRQC